MNNKLSVLVLHNIEGRLRLKLSSGILKPDSLKKNIKRHPGIINIRYTEITHTILVNYDSECVSEAELLLRVGIYFSLENNTLPVSVSFSGESEKISKAGYLSGTLLILGFLAKFLPVLSPYAKTIESAAAVTTAFSVITHGLEEIGEKGTFDPEVISVFYLLYAMLRSNGFNASAITWGTSFGRHMIQPLPEILSIHPKLNREEKAYEVDIRKTPQTNLIPLAFRTVPTLVFDFITGGVVGKETLIKQIKHVSEEHNKIIEGLTSLENGFKLKIN